MRALVYVDAFVPDEGETVFQILGGSGSALDVPDPTTVLDLVGYPGAPEGDVEAFLKPDTVHNSFAQDLSEADRWLIVASQRPITLSANTTPSGAAAWKTLPSWAVVGTEDRVIPPDTQRSMAERAGATITEVAGSHVSMVSHPQVTIDAILAAVGRRRRLTFPTEPGRRTRSLLSAGSFTGTVGIGVIEVGGPGGCSLGRRRRPDRFWSDRSVHPVHGVKKPGWVALTGRPDPRVVGGRAVAAPLPGPGSAGHTRVAGYRPRWVRRIRVADRTDQDPAGTPWVR